MGMPCRRGQTRVVDTQQNTTSWGADRSAQASAKATGHCSNGAGRCFTAGYGACSAGLVKFLCAVAMDFACQRQHALHGTWLEHTGANTRSCRQHPGLPGEPRQEPQPSCNRLKSPCNRQGQCSGVEPTRQGCMAQSGRASPPLLPTANLQPPRTSRYGSQF